MLCLTIPTNLLDSDDEPVKLGPYSFADEEVRDEWVADLDVALDRLNRRLQRPSFGPHCIKMSYEYSEGMFCIAPAPPVKYLIDQLHKHWDEGDVSLALDAAAA